MIGAFAEGNPFKEYRVVAAPMSVGTEDEPDYLVQLKEYHDEAIPKQPAPEHFEESGKTKIIDVEVPVTTGEENLRHLIRNLHNIQNEALASAAGYNEQKKLALKALFEAGSGKSYTRMECRIENDWENAVRRYIRPDTGEVALVEQISYEERQQVLKLETPGDTIEPTIDTLTVETAPEIPIGEFVPEESGTEMASRPR